MLGIVCACLRKQFRKVIHFACRADRARRAFTTKRLVREQMSRVQISRVQNERMAGERIPKADAESELSALISHVNYER